MGFCSKSVGRTTTATQNAKPMRIVGHQPRIMGACDAANFAERSNIAIHRKHAIGENKRVTILIAFGLCSNSSK